MESYNLDMTATEITFSSGFGHNLNDNLSIKYNIAQHRNIIYELQLSMNLLINNFIFNSHKSNIFNLEK